MQIDLREEYKIRNGRVEKPNQKITDFLNKIKSDIDVVRPRLISKILYIKQFYYPNNTYNEYIKYLEEQLNNKKLFKVPHRLFVDTIKSMIRLDYR